LEPKAVANQTNTAAFIRHCDKQIAELEQMKLTYPEEMTCLNRLVIQWEQTKLRLLPTKG
jgi:hypothetical protein